MTHPAQLFGYFVMLVGNVIPLSTTGIESHLWVHGLQGAVLLLAAILVVAQSLRERLVQPYPLPLVLTVFALLFDIVTALGRIGDKLQSAVSPTYDHYTMPNIILLVAIVTYAWSHAPKLDISHGLRLVRAWRADGAITRSVRRWDDRWGVPWARLPCNERVPCSDHGKSESGSEVGEALLHRRNRIPRLGYGRFLVSACPTESLNWFPIRC